MITTAVKVKVVAFLVLGLLATGYLLRTYVGVDPLRDDTRVTVELSDASGLFEGSEVTYRGVSIGTVDELEVTDTGTDVQVVLDADAPPVPADVDVTVANRSAIGEQYLDLVPREAGDDDRAVLADGDRVVATDATVPPAFDAVLRSGRDFVASVPEDALRTVVDETYLAARGVSPDVAQLVETSLAWAQTADANFLVTTRLIESSATVLDRQLASADAIRSFSGDLELLAATLRDSDGDLRALIGATPPAALQLRDLVAEVGRPLGLLLTNLVTPAQVFGVNSAGVEDLMIRLPDAVSAGWAVTSTGSLNLSLVPNFANPLPCTTGYEGTPRRAGDATGGGAFDTDAGCTLTSGPSNVRGPGAVPSNLDDLAVPVDPGTARPTGGAPVVIRDATSLEDLMGGIG
ncbi:phospholipid/cholesterol/gamma-HCH transport system substrate-binding protein [Nocardioides zeae]|uniref:Phospholipid/cholesterol/gamma-HCH transport system substrate-binding protein n=2 Tax=Nocardioides zeae TaxID=1457234 RepID=A0AAJ1U3A5_9ACTN|nr:MlaD family protein [Nocardioides zeae]MDQ1105120.1 phospholipid/cholesterol/gamma-HCH transport system substrate-binding protein [Nocardioides zeae]MDR6175165.1 phospholipid/cholesterol/gamma-HCH transport system substrate-binding protein [Nocardioides zeae]MDR6211342.1 phospholipid/cholesterol/gamma-HCH transport system substrate-binding protein [Nocardioides zeae]